MRPRAQLSLCPFTPLLTHCRQGNADACRQLSSLKRPLSRSQPLRHAVLPSPARHPAARCRNCRLVLCRLAARATARHAAQPGRSRLGTLVPRPPLHVELRPSLLPKFDVANGRSLPLQVTWLPPWVLWCNTTQRAALPFERGRVSTRAQKRSLSQMRE